MQFKAHPTSRWSFALIFGILAVTLGAVFMSMTVLIAPAHVSYAVSADHVKIEANLGPFDHSRTLARPEITAARLVNLHGGARIAGTGLPDYCQGEWRYPELGMVWQVTTCTPTGVVLETEEGRVVVSPQDREAFIAAVQSGEAREFPAVPGASRGVLPWMGAIPLLILGALALLFSKIWGVSYQIEHGALRVPANLRTLSVPLAGAKVARYSPERIWRLVGTGLPQLYLGLYRVDGRNMHVAATRRSDGVLVEGERVMWITPEDPEAFLQEAERAGAKRG